MPLPYSPAARAVRIVRLIMGGLLLTSTVACGYKGPLYLPPPEDPPATLTEPPAPGAPSGSSVN